MVSKEEQKDQGRQVIPLPIGTPPVRRDVEIIITEAQMDLVKRTVFPDAGENELALFIYDCQRRGVHPLDRLIIPTMMKQGEGEERRYIPIVTVDFLRSRADMTGEYVGSDDAVFEVQGTVPIRATVTVWRLVGGQRCAFTASARMSEYRPNSQGRQFTWNKMPHIMLAKCAEALALRKAFPQQLSGLYTGEEMEQAHPAPMPRGTRIITGETGPQPTGAVSTPQGAPQGAHHPWLVTCPEHNVAWRQGQYGLYHPGQRGEPICDARKTIGPRAKETIHAAEAVLGWDEPAGLTWVKEQYQVPWSKLTLENAIDAMVRLGKLASEHLAAEETREEAVSK